MLLVPFAFTGLPAGHAAFGAHAPGGLDHWMAPACPAVLGGEGALTYSLDGGATTAATMPPMSPVTYAHVAVLDLPNRLVALANDSIHASVDAGCTWVPIASPGDVTQFDVVAGPSGVAYAFEANGPDIHRIAGMRVDHLTGPAAGGVVGLGVDPSDANHLRAVARDGQPYESMDGGATWVALGNPPDADLFVYSAAISRTDPDTIVVGTMRNGAFLSTDAGRKWRQARGLVQGRGAANVFSVVLSPVDSRTVWLQGYDLAATGNGARKIWRSTNGGRTFREVLDGNRVRLTNGIVMAPSPQDAEALYFVFGTWFGGYGTDLYRYDAATDRLTSTHHDYDDITSIAFHPDDPEVMYFGLAEER